MLLLQDISKLHILNDKCEMDVMTRNNDGIFYCNIEPLAFQLLAGGLTTKVRRRNITSSRVLVEKIAVEDKDFQN